MESINSNNAVNIQKITALEVWRDEHERRTIDRAKQRDEREEYVDGEIAELSISLGKESATMTAAIKRNTERLEALEKIEQQGRGALMVWRVIVVVLSSGAALFEFWHHYGKGPTP